MAIMSYISSSRALINIFYILCLVTTATFFFSYKENFCLYIPENKVQNNLYKATIRHILQKTKTDCKYDRLLRSTKSVHTLTQLAKLLTLNFSATGIVNGAYIPEYCNPLFSIAILVTIRNRTSQLRFFLPYIHNFLRKQNIHYKIYMIEQQDKKPWNKGLLYNIGASQAIAVKFPCLILHDVDMLPLDDRNLYVCSRQPRHMSANVDKWKYMLPYDTLVGGVLAIRSDQYVAVNGFSNRFHGWGGEDDDFAARMLAHGLHIIRYPWSMSRYTMLSHRPEAANPDRFRILAENRNLTGDGLKSTRFTSMAIKNLRLFTWIKVKT